MNCNTFSVGSLLSSLFLVTAAAAQDPSWLSSPGSEYSGVSGTVYKTIEWDPDGAGPAPSRLVIAGSFSEAGGVKASNVAIWDGANYIPLAGGVSGTVNDVCIFQNELYVAGAFASASNGAGGVVVSPGIARWNGTSWSALGSGLGGTSITASALLVFEGSLVVTGKFSQAGGQTAQNVATWNGASWASYGSLGCDRFSQLIEFGGKLFASGCATRMRDDQGVWQSTGGSTYFGPMGVIDNHLDVIENTSALSNDYSIWYEWNGTGWTSRQWAPYPNALSAIKQFNGTIYAAQHELPHFANTYVSNGGVYLRANNAWGTYYQAQRSVLTLGEYRGNLLAGGRFSAIQQTPAADLAVMDQGVWKRVGHGIAAAPYAMSWANDTLYAFSGTEMDADIVTSIDRLGPAGWEQISTASNHFGTAALAFHGAVYITGSLTTDTGNAILARLDGSQLASVADTPAPTSQNDRGVGAVYHDELIVGSDRGVFAWNGTTWRTIAPDPGLVSIVKVINGDLFVAGTFTSIGGVAATNIARWDGAAWHAVAGMGPYQVTSLAGFQGNLCFAGTMTSGGHLGVWMLLENGWNIIGDVGNHFVYKIEIEEFGGDLYAAGDFTTISGVAANRIARWNGTTWLPLGPGVDFEVDSLSANGALLAVGGKFSHTGTNIAANFALWGVEPPPYCIGDFNRDGGVDGSDVPAFFDAWQAGDAAADLNQDGGMDGADVETFFAAWEAGC